MNIYFDYLLENFGGAHLIGAKIISELIADYDITNLFKAYHDYAKDNDIKYHNVERAIRHYIQVIDSTRGIENTLKCKCFNGKNFSNKEFLATVKVRAEEYKCQENI